MVGLGISTSNSPNILLVVQQLPIQIQPISRPHHHHNNNNNKNLSININHSFSRTKTPKRLKTFGVIQSKKREEEEEEEEEELKKKKKKDGGGGGGSPPEFNNNLKWASDLVLNPDPDNIFAVALTGLLAWASVQVLGQLLFISLAILVAALKYSFIAALLIFILITLL